MSEKTILLVYDEADHKRAEVNVLDDQHMAARLVETLLEQGYKQAHIRIYTGVEMEMQVTHRPVVALVGDTLEIGASADRGQADTEQALPRAKAESRTAEANAAPGTKDGVRFSSLFRAG